MHFERSQPQPLEALGQPLDLEGRQGVRSEVPETRSSDEQRANSQQHKDRISDALSDGTPRARWNKAPNVELLVRPSPARILTRERSHSETDHTKPTKFRADTTKSAAISCAGVATESTPSSACLLGLGSSLAVQAELSQRVGAGVQFWRSKKPGGSADGGSAIASSLSGPQSSMKWICANSSTKTIGCVGPWSRRRRMSSRKAF